MDVQIEGRQTTVTPELRADIEARVEDLHPEDITHIRVTLTELQHKKADDSCDVIIVVQIPGHTLTARKRQNSFEEALRDTFAAMEVELDKVREKRATHEVRLNAPPERGVVTKLFPKEGYGFITVDDGTEVYFHKNAVHDLNFEELDGMAVSLNVGQGHDGPQATTVNPVPSVAEHYAEKGSVT